MIDVVSLGGTLVTVGPSEIASCAKLSAGGTYERQWRYFVWPVAQHNL